MTIADPTYCWYTLFSTKGVGRRTINAVRSALSRHGLTLDAAASLSWADLHEAIPEIPRETHEKFQDAGSGSAWDEYENLIDSGIAIIHPDHPIYPYRASEFLGTYAPALLFCKGNLSLLRNVSVAIVGSRRASNDNLEFASDLASGLARQGINVISGYATGVDNQAHLGALRSGGTTTMVLSSGVLDFRRRSDYRAMPWEGNVLVISQFHPREKWLARNAMLRNKLVCALSSAVVVIESGPQRDDQGRMSGTFDAGLTALNLGVPLFVLPPEDAGVAATGNGELIRHGGVRLSVTRSGEQIAAVLRSPVEGAPSSSPVALQGRLAF